MTSRYFIGCMMPESANPVQQPETIIEISAIKGGWQCYEGPGVGPYWIGEKAKDDATHYAMTRAKFARGEIRVLNVDGSLDRAIPFDRENRESDLI
jgi:hypothetical protein